MVTTPDTATADPIMATVFGPLDYVTIFEAAFTRTVSHPISVELMCLCGWGSEPHRNIPELGSWRSVLHA